MTIPLDPKQIVSYEEFLMSQAVQQEALTRLLMEKGIFTKEEFLEMVRVVNEEMEKKQKGIKYSKVGVKMAQRANFPDDIFPCKDCVLIVQRKYAKHSIRRSPISFTINFD